MTVTIRGARRGDEAEILRLIRALATFEREADAVVATQDMIASALFCEGGHVHAHLAERDGRIIGLALWFLNFSTWTGKPGLYLEDLFVDADERGGGVARALMATLAQVALDRGCARMDWAVLDWNADAIAFYRRIGARFCDDWQPWRIDGDALVKLAQTASRGPSS